MQISVKIFFEMPDDLKYQLLLFYLNCVLALVTNILRFIHMQWMCTYKIIQNYVQLSIFQWIFICRACIKKAALNQSKYDFLRRLDFQEKRGGICYASFSYDLIGIHWNCVGLMYGLKQHTAWTCLSFASVTYKQEECSVCKQSSKIYSRSTLLKYVCTKFDESCHIALLWKWKNCNEDTHSWWFSLSLSLLRF